MTKEFFLFNGYSICTGVVQDLFCKRILTTGVLSYQHLGSSMVLHVGCISFCCLRCFWSSSCIVIGLIVSSCSKLLTVDMRVFDCLSMSCWTGEPRVSDHGVLRYSSNARYGSFPSCAAFFISLLIVCTAFSAMPLECGCYGLYVWWSIQ